MQAKPTAEDVVRARAVQSALREEIIGRLQQLSSDVDAVRANDGFRALLAGCARLARYSFSNQCLILRRAPNASSVLPRTVWEFQGRTIRNGEHPIEIFAPSSPQGWPFILVPVFDVAQTEGDALPAVDAPDGETEWLPRIEAAGAHLGIAVESLAENDRNAEAGRVIGLSLGGRVQIAASLRGTKRAATLVHEFAHEILHQAPDEVARPDCRAPVSVAETEAQGTAFVVLQHLGIPAEAPGYIVWMGGDGKDVLRSVTRITQAAKAILTAIVDRKNPRVRISKPPRRSDQPKKRKAA